MRESKVGEKSAEVFRQDGCVRLHFPDVGYLGGEKTYSTKL